MFDRVDLRLDQQIDHKAREISDEKPEDAQRTALAVEALGRMQGVDIEQNPKLKEAVLKVLEKTRGTPDFVKIFKDMGVNAVHLGDFHGDGHQLDHGPFRLPELEALFKE